MVRWYDYCPGIFDTCGGDENLNSNTKESSNQLQSKMGTTMTVTICPCPCLDSLGWVYATLNTVAYCCTSRTMELSFWPVLGNGCVRNTMPLHVCDHTTRHSVACIAVPATKLDSGTGCTTNSQIPFFRTTNENNI